MVGRIDDEVLIGYQTQSFQQAGQAEKQCSAPGRRIIQYILVGIRPRRLCFCSKARQLAHDKSYYIPVFIWHLPRRQGLVLCCSPSGYEQ